MREGAWLGLTERLGAVAVFWSLVVGLFPRPFNNSGPNSQQQACNMRQAIVAHNMAHAKKPVECLPERPVTITQLSVLYAVDVQAPGGGSRFVMIITYTTTES
jgi:hypothetical protein